MRADEGPLYANLESLRRLLKSMGVSMLGSRTKDWGLDCSSEWQKIPSSSVAELLALSGRVAPGVGGGVVLPPSRPITVTPSPADEGMGLKILLLLLAR